MIELTRQAVYFPNPKHPCFNVQNFGLRPVMQDGIPAASPTMHGSTESHSSCPLGLLLVVGCGLWLRVVGCELWLWVVVVGCGLWVVVVGCGLWVVLVLVLVLVLVVVVVVVVVVVDVDVDVGCWLLVVVACCYWCCCSEDAWFSVNHVGSRSSNKWCVILRLYLLLTSAAFSYSSPMLEVLSAGTGESVAVFEHVELADASVKALKQRLTQELGIPRFRLRLQ